METVRDFKFFGTKITADGDCSYDIIRCLLLGRMSMANVDSVLKSRGTRDQIANIHWITEKTRQFQKNIYICFMDCVDHKPVENS